MANLEEKGVYNPRASHSQHKSTATIYHPRHYTVVFCYDYLNSYIAFVDEQVSELICRESQLWVLFGVASEDSVELHVV